MTGQAAPVTATGTELAYALYRALRAFWPERVERFDNRPGEEGATMWFTYEELIASGGLLHEHLMRTKREYESYRDGPPDLESILERDKHVAAGILAYVTDPWTMTDDDEEWMVG